MSPFWKPFKKLKRKKKTTRQRPIKYCPQCRNPTLNKTISGIWVNTEHYRCTNINCDYEGAFYLEVDPEESGKNLVDLDELKRDYPEDLDPDTEITINRDLLQKAHASTPEGDNNT